MGPVRSTKSGVSLGCWENLQETMALTPQIAWGLLLVFSFNEFWKRHEMAIVYLK